MIKRLYQSGLPTLQVFVTTGRRVYHQFEVYVFFGNSVYVILYL